jgi:hypothetical protein
MSEQEVSEPTQLKVDQLVSIYLKMRNKKAALEKEIKAIEAQQEQVEIALLDEAKLLGVKSFGTKHGTVIRSTKERLFSTDMPAFREFVLENKCVDLFESRLAQNAVKAWVEANPDKIPPGLQSDSKETISIRKAN